VTLAGTELAGFESGLPAASVRLLLPGPGHELVIPQWNGNEFLFGDGTRPPIRTVTPLAHDRAADALDVEVVLHGNGPLSAWAAGVVPGTSVALSGPGRGYEVDPASPAFLLAGDESALPAITTLIPVLPATANVHVVVEVMDAAARLDLPLHPHLTEHWCTSITGGRPGDALLDAIVDLPIATDTRIWVAGEASAMQRIRKHLFEQRSVPRRLAVVRGYWK
jgi:NADPH-dependent ferric siderophore reductase